MKFGADCHTDGGGLRWYDNIEEYKADLNNDGRVNMEPAGDTPPGDPLSFIFREKHSSGANQL